MGILHSYIVFLTGPKKVDDKSFIIYFLRSESERTLQCNFSAALKLLQDSKVTFASHSKRVGGIDFPETLYDRVFKGNFEAILNSLPN